MNREVVSLLQGAPRHFFVDCTLGMGGHAREILDHIPDSRILGVDEDGESLARAGESLAHYGDRVILHHGNFVRLFEEAACDWQALGGMLVDPGLSSAQLKEGSRGFSHSEEGPLDMRKDRRGAPTAHDVINTFKERELAQIFSTLGEVSRPGELAKKIIERRLFSPINTTTELRRLVEEFYHWRPRPGLLHPAARVFQSLRIFVNRELEGLAGWISRIPHFLKSGSRLVFLAYHSIEDRIVKQSLRSLAQAGLLCLIRPFPQFPQADEVEQNPPSRSARLRAAEIA